LKDRESSDNGMTIVARVISLRSAAVAFAARVLLATLFLLLGPMATLKAQMPEPGSPLEGWGMMAPQDPAAGNVTVVPRTAAPDSPAEGADVGAVPVEFVAFLTDDGQRIEQGVVWRLYEPTTSGDRRGKLMDTERTASPVLSLKPGSYIVNAAFGRAHLTRKITVPAAANAPRQVEKFVLNAGGLRITALLGGKPAPPGSITYAIHTDRDQTDDRRLILAGAKPGLVIRLNAGIYHVVSTYGDANAIVRSDVTVEAGKLTEATIVHTYAKVSFKLVERAGGEALPDTQWTIQTPEGGIVKESVGALPSHTLAPGRYTVVARNQAKAFRKDFTVQDGQNEAIEIVLQ
jgi:hypothetical protein